MPTEVARAIERVATLFERISCPMCGKSEGHVSVCAIGTLIAAAKGADAKRWQWARTHPNWLGFDHDMMPHEIDNALDLAIKESP